MKLETEINHNIEKIKKLRLRIEDHEKELYGLYKQLSRRDYENLKKEYSEPDYFHEYLLSRLSNLYFLAHLDQSEFARIQIDAEIDVLNEIKDKKTKKCIKHDTVECLECTI